MRRLVLVFALLVLGGDGAGAATELIVFEAASLKDALAPVASAFESAHPGVRVILNAAGSQELRAQIEHGAPADLFASADRNQLYPLAAAGLVEAPVVFACNRLALITRRELGSIRTLGDLPRAERIVLGVPDVPIGAYTAALLDRAAALYGHDFPARVAGRVVSRELNVRQVTAKVVMGEADAAIVYASDAAAAADKVRIVPIPDAINLLAEYPVAAVHGAAHAAQARSFIALLRGPVGAAALKRAGFVSCPAP